jgi:hypothetical protein
MTYNATGGMNLFVEHIQKPQNQKAGGQWSGEVERDC